MNINYISLGSCCSSSDYLVKLSLRKESLPFDFLLTTPSHTGINYVNNVIKNNFTDYIEDLEYNSGGKVFSKNYPNTLFWHHDLIKNKQKIVKSLKIDHLNMEEPLLDKFKRRGKRFLNNIKNKETIFIFTFKYKDFLDNKKYVLDNIFSFFSTIDNKTNKKFHLLIIFNTRKDKEMKIDISDLNKIDNKLTFLMFNDACGCMENSLIILSKLLENIKSNLLDTSPSASS